MSEHLLINPEQLYFLYSVKDIKKDYYDFSIFPDYHSIEIEIFYDILNCLSMYELQNLLIFIYKQWSLFKLNTTLQEFTNNKRKKTILKQKDTDTKAIEKELSAALGLRVFIEHSAGGENGSIILKYKTLEEFDRVRDLLIGED